MSFALGSEVMLLHPLLSWTIAILNASKISNFSLYLDPAVVDSRNLDLFLSQLNMPALSLLTIWSGQLSLTSLNNFLYRHQVTALNLDRNTITDDSSVISPMCVDRLLGLEGAASSLRMFLRGTSALTVLTSLHFTSIVTSDFDDIRHILHLLADTSDNTSDSSNSPSPPTTIGLKFQTKSDFKTYIAQGWHPGSGPRGSETKLRRVKRLEISPPWHYRVTESDVLLLSHRLDFFPELQELRLPDFCQDWARALPSTVRLVR